MFNSENKESITTNIKDSAGEPAENLNHIAHHAGQKVRNMLQTARDELSHAGDCVGTEIRSNPVRSSIIALGVGVLLGALMRR